MDTCIACRSTVRPRQERLLCELCNQWQHRTCTDISQAAYRRAVKGLEEIKWTCTPCTNSTIHAVVREITADVSLSEEEMPSTMDSSSVSVGLPEEDMSAMNTSTGFVPQEEVPILDTSLGFEPQAPESYTAERSYTLPELILEDSIDDAPVFDTPADEDPRYIILEGGSERGNKKLLDREGYSYIFRKESANGNVNWRCVHRPKIDYCRATVIQIGDDFRPGLKNHNHPAQPGQHIAAQINTQVRKNLAKEVFTTSSAKVVEKILMDIASETAPFPSRPKMATMVRNVNRYRQKSRHDDPNRGEDKSMPKK